MSERLLPTGSCWCGCGIETCAGSFFARGHDKIVEAAFIAVRHGGSVARLLADNKFGPEEERSVTKAAIRGGSWIHWIHCTRPGCKYTGTETSKHEANPHKEN